MSSTNDVSVAPSESAEAKRVRRLQRRRETERELVVCLKQRNNWNSGCAEEGSETELGVKPSQLNKEDVKDRNLVVCLKQRNNGNSAGLSRRRIRDRGRREAQSVEQRQRLLQRRRERLNAESGEQRDVRLQQMRELTRDGRAAESY